MLIPIKQNKEIEYWYVMLHLEPQLIEKLLKAENEVRVKEDSKEPFVFLIPFQFLERAISNKTFVPESEGKQQGDGKTPDEVAENNSLRNLLHNFVFIKSTRH